MYAAKVQPDTCSLQARLHTPILAPQAAGHSFRRPLIASAAVRGTVLVLQVADVPRRSSTIVSTFCSVVAFAFRLPWLPLLSPASYCYHLVRSPCSHPAEMGTGMSGLGMTALHRSAAAAAAAAGSGKDLGPSSRTACRRTTLSVC